MKLKIFHNFKIINVILLFSFLFPLSPESYALNRSQEQSILNLNLEYKQQFDLGEKSKKQGNFREAVEYYSSALSSARQIQNQKKECNSLLKLGLMYWNMGLLKESTEFYSAAQDIAKKFNLNEQLTSSQFALAIYTFYNEGKKFRKSGNFQQSLQSFQKALDIAKEIGSKEHQLKCLRVQSATYWAMKNLKQFRSSNEAALSIAKNLNHKKEEGRCSNNIGLFYSKFENYSKALHYLEKSLNIAKNLDNKEEISNCLSNIGIIYKNIGNFDKALDYLSEALEIDNELGNNLNISTDLNDIGATLRNKGIISENEEYLYQALTYFDNCLKLTKKINDKENEILVYNNIGSVYSDLEEYGNALKFFTMGYQIAKELNDVERMGMIQNNLGIVHFNQGNYGESTKYFQEAIDLAQKIQDGKILWEAYLELARTYTKQKNYPEAIEKYKESINQIENIRSQIDLEELKASFLGTDKRIEAYHNLINLLVYLHQPYPEKNYNKEAFEYLERAKARAFLDRLKISNVNIYQHIDFKLQNREKEVEKDISSIYTKLYSSGLNEEDSENLYKELRDKEYEYENLKREIRTKSPAYANLNYPSIITLIEAQKLLDSRTAFFEYIIGKEESYAFVITKKSFTIFPLPQRKQIQKMITEYLKLLSDKENQNFQTGYDIYKTLVSPGLNKNIKNIIFIPDDILNFLPFETLCIREDENYWLIQDINMAYSPSISSLKEIIQRKKINKGKRIMDLLAFGDPYIESNENKYYRFDSLKNSDQNNSQFTRLKYSSTEIERINHLFNKRKTSIFLRKNASEDQFKKHPLGNYKIIHFATHSQIDNKRPYGSYILLSTNDNPEENGLLQTREIYNLDLNADLVTLSACETGLGKFIKGEGIAGLNRAFFYAGTSSVMMSLWPVNDQATSQLMERFYFHLHSSESIMNSLRKAKLEMIASDALSHPYYWASFIISGKADQIIFSNSFKSWILVSAFCLLISGLILVVSRRKKLFIRNKTVTLKKELYSSPYR